jgi:hypothetical protein
VYATWVQTGSCRCCTDSAASSKCARPCLMCATRAKRDRPVHDTAKWDRSERDGPSARHGCDGIPHGMGRAAAVRGGIGGEGRAYARLRAAAGPRVRAGTHPLPSSSMRGCGRRRHSVRSAAPSGSALARSAALQAKHAESLAVAVKVARVLTRLCEQVMHTRTHERTLSHTHTRTLSHTRARTHMRAPTCTHTRAHAHRRIQAGRQGCKDHEHRAQHAHAIARTRARKDWHADCSSSAAQPLTHAAAAEAMALVFALFTLRACAAPNQPYGGSAKRERR